MEVKNPAEIESPSIANSPSGQIRLYFLNKLCFKKIFRNWRVASMTVKEK